MDVAFITCRIQEAQLLKIASVDFVSHQTEFARDIPDLHKL